MPTFYPRHAQEILDLGARGRLFARERLWSRAEDRHQRRRRRRHRPGLARGVCRPARGRRHAPAVGNLLAPASMELEHSLFGTRLRSRASTPRLTSSTRSASPLRARGWGSSRRKVYYELVQALRDLGLRQRTSSTPRAGLMKSACSTRTTRRLCRLCARARRDPRRRGEAPYLETAIRDALYGGSDQPRVLGKELLPAEGDLDADTIALAVASRVKIDGLESRVERSRHAAPRCSADRWRSRAPRSSARAAPTTARPTTPTTRCSRRHRLPHDGAPVPGGQGTVTGLTQMAARRAVRRHAAVHRGRALRAEPRRRDVPPLRLARRPLRGRRRHEPSPTSCSTTTPSR